ncbi:MAG: hypothetical protein HRU19_03335 [Pseudobacteriovorax sp.]|nr:hypothetical protein [Pseudobacteriovorax sp.]
MKTRNFIALLLAVLCTNVLLGHKQQISYTQVEFSKAGNTLEISHRFNLHDAEHAVAAIFPKSSGIHSDKKLQAAFAAYIEKNFKVAVPGQPPLGLELLGFEVDDGNFWIYQESKSALTTGEIVLSATGLYEFWPSHVHQVNYKSRQGKIKSLQFRKGDDLKTLRLLPAKTTSAKLKQPQS